ncbi:hypothetical protein FQN60_006875 [Etheostoma spectabile]|uniref:Uncharacterized protein n=1 Tax=Etheostoma spectabile TaxID=54343 RepID=A0A5J5CDA8_9PERO|nr:hypothetical protein FQN60_006875 [Etheostoma spectabile]
MTFPMEHMGRPVETFGSVFLRTLPARSKHVALKVTSAEMSTSDGSFGVKIKGNVQLTVCRLTKSTTDCTLIGTSAECLCCKTIAELNSTSVSSSNAAPLSLRVCPYACSGFFESFFF